MELPGSPGYPNGPTHGIRPVHGPSADDAPYGWLYVSPPANGDDRLLPPTDYGLRRIYRKSVTTAVDQGTS